MAIPKTALKSAMSYTKIIKPDDAVINEAVDQFAQTFEDNKSTSKLTFRKDTMLISKTIDSLSCPDIIMLSGSEKKVIIYLSQNPSYEEMNKLLTKPINQSIMSKETGIPITTLKKSIQRLEKKGFIDRSSFKAGRDGWTIYSISVDICKQLSK